MIWGQKFAVGNTVEFDSLRFDFAGLAVLVCFVHDNITHSGLEFVVRVTVAKILKSLL
jgi:hypothetical protein